MRKRMVMGMGLLIVLAVVVSGCTAAAQAGGPLTSVATQAEEQARRTISVTGNGTATAAPDVAYVVIGVESINEDAALAVEDSTKRMDAVMAALEELGIAAKDVQTVNYNMWLEQTAKPEVRTLVETDEPQLMERYHVANQVRVTVRDMTKVSDLLEKALQAGANRVEGITFGIEDTDALSEQAREEAIADAKAKADQLATGFGAKVGAVYSVSEWGGSEPVMYAAADRMGMGGGGVPVSGGELTVNVQIQVQFEIAE